MIEKASETFDFASRIQYLRTKHGWTQAQLAERLYTTRGSINNWEQGISIPAMHVIVKIADRFNISLDYLIGRDDRECLYLTNLPEDCKKIIYQTVDCFRRYESFNQE